MCDSSIYFGADWVMFPLMGRWIFITLCIVALVVGGYWLLQHEGIQNCNNVGGDWDYARWKCNTG
jgi:hypothetical protein